MQPQPIPASRASHSTASTPHATASRAPHSTASTLMLRLLCTLGLAASTLILSLALPAHAFERTQTCYPPGDGRTPTCEDNATPLTIRWLGPCTTWRTHEHFPDELLQPVKDSFETWNQVESSYFRTFYAGSTDQFGAAYDCQNEGSGNENVVSVLEDWPSSVAGSNVVALTTVTYHVSTGTIVDADIRMNADHFEWQVVTHASQDESIVDIGNIMTHEIGHFLGLDHSIDATYAGELEAQEATMWAQTYPNEVKRRELDLDDILGVSAIYPLNARPHAACVPPESVNHAPSPEWFRADRTVCSDKGAGGCCSTTEAQPLPLTLIFAVTSALFFLRQRAHARGEHTVANTVEHLPL